MQVAEDGEFDAAIPGDAIGFRGLQYYVAAVDPAGNVATSPAAGPDAPADVQITFQDQVAVAAQPTRVWRMVSVPALPLNGSPFEVLAALGAYDDTRWRLFRYFLGSYKELTAADIGNFDPGRAFWLQTRDAGIRMRSGGGSTVALAESFAITLTPGWNDIGTPFAFAVRWDDVLSASGDPVGVAGPYEFDGSAWTFPQATDVLQPWEGYAVKNPQSSSVALLVPPRAAQGAAKPASGNGPAGADWSLQLRLTAGSAADLHNYVGVHAAAAITWDRLDLPEPPLAPGQTVRLLFPHLDWNEFPDDYTSDFRPHAGGQAWDFAVEGSADLLAELQVVGLETLPPGHVARLVDLDGGVVYPLALSDSPALSLSARRERRHFRLVVGAEEFVEAGTAAFVSVPERFQLEAAFPNPFNSGVVVPFQLPETTRVRVTVYDLLGQEVTRLADGRRDPGYYRVRWKGLDPTGRMAASGVYFIAVDAGGVRQLARVMLIR